MSRMQNLRAHLAIGHRLTHLAGLLLPIRRNKIVLDNFRGRGYGCEPKYICEELRRRNASLDLVWLLDPRKSREEAGIPADVRCVPYGTKKAMLELATARIWVDNVKNAQKPDKRKGQFYLQTWHSLLGLKQNERNAESKLDPEYIAGSKRDAAMTDLMFSNNDVRLNLYKTRYWYDGPVIKCGVPHCSVLIDPSQKKAARDKVLRHYALPDDARIVLYVPTFRAYGNHGDVQLDYSACLSAFQRRFCGESSSSPSAPYVMLWRAHPNLSEAGQDDPSKGIYNASLYPDVYELIAASAVVISDYSDCAFSAALAKIPTFLYAPDIDAYMNGDRSLYFTMDELPFPISTDQEMLHQQIASFSADHYQQRVDAFLARTGLEDDGAGAAKIADILLDIIEGRERAHDWK